MRTLYTLLCLALALTSGATHFLGGEIRYAQIEGNTFQIEGILYANLDSPADRPEITFYVNGEEIVVPRTPPQDCLDTGCGSVRISTYPFSYTFPAPGAYDIHFDDINRVPGILNVPNSVNTSVCITARIVIDPLLGSNASPRFNTPQYVTNWVWSTLLHDPGATEADGDSVAYEMVVTLNESCEPVLGYVKPPGQILSFVDLETGVFHWNTPPAIGFWNLCIRASEWRNGVLIGQVTRDMMVCVYQIANGLAENEVLKPLAAFVSDDGAWLNLLGPGNEPFRVEIYDPLGALVGTHRLGASGSMVPIADLRTGAYIARVVERSGVTRQARFVLQ